MSRILVVDDEEMIRFAFEEFLKDEGHEPLIAKEAETALQLVRDREPEIVFLDYRLPGRNGLALLRDIREIRSSVAVVFMTAFGAMDVAIKAMQSGAYEYLTKPLDLDRIRVLIGRIVEGRRSVEAIRFKGETSEAVLDQMVGKSQVMQDIFKMIGLLTTQNVTVLITGESGVGKELVAKAIHDNSHRRDRPFVALNCGAMPENLLEAEMFGYEKGAFTGADAQKPGKLETAGNGTVFMDEIGELQLSLQVKLLRVLQERTFDRVGGNRPIRTDARFIAATNKDLLEEVRRGRFRKDLYYRLHLINIHLPPLRERKEDIPSLVEYFIKKSNIEMGRQVRGITESAMRRLTSHPWPGNVRELENQVKRAMVLYREEVLPEYLFETELAEAVETIQGKEERLEELTRQYVCNALAHPESSQSLFSQVTGIVEIAMIQEALRRTEGNQLQAAELLGMNRSTLRKKKKDYGI